ncbi:methyltransferase family protein [Kineococcus xinjiangensis]|uniref:Methyltransferase family protein n=1 Tax=Kineococcus xinjiangensis TaxID=512762 RepID=A0A2S6IVQ6_9ACTN|nr:methyltransferase [Kineococcus xinjiangensis]PPK98447.1 methyltransferase family protein [Kineococcus xinjiangensis]
MAEDSTGDVAGDAAAGAGQHYFTAQPAAPDERRRLRVHLAGRSVEVETARGVFSAERLDPGTAVLLPHLDAAHEEDAPDEAQGDAPVLDLGCGWGPVALSLALHRPQRPVWAVDVNERALDLLRSTAARLGLDAVHCALPDDVPAEVRFASIWSNPPIRIGKAELHALLQRWLPRLRPGGAAHLVVQRNLGADSLHRWLAEGGVPGTVVEREGSSKGFRVLRVTASGTAPG